MSSISISIPENLKNWIKTQTSSGYYTSVSDYLRTLIRNDQTKQQTLDDELLKGLKSHTFEIDDAFWQNKKDQIKKQYS